MTTPCLTVVLPSLRRRHYQHEPLGHGSPSGARPALVERYQPVEQVALLDRSPGPPAEQECLTSVPVERSCSTSEHRLSKVVLPCLTSTTGQTGPLDRHTG
ncbi:hypothetical protein PCANC_15803 [Puccinia coronata f. sp. avenae]|uniref:Uncharacterized protein n=1 Tax=Puccinia coronata f. sp. avenae TaxID=200324 RepID=A0A2N5UE48_9BASI|nr:hypothetical protein PCASD_20668 [Puccinia coronata f. sp. avenae]PLW35980.1 hypothetical protein PCANC_15803 [Puccinia coronata f. sp. avenae]